MPRFAAIGLDHRHVYDLTAGLLEAGAACAGHDPETTDPRVLAGFRKRFPDVPAVSRERLLDDPTIDFLRSPETTLAFRVDCAPLLCLQNSQDVHGRSHL